MKHDDGLLELFEEDEISDGKENFRGKLPEMLYQPLGKEILDEDTMLFLVEFVKNCLTPLEMLIFHCYYINGWTFRQTADAYDCSYERDGKWEYRDCSAQRIEQIIRVIDKKMRSKYKTRYKWMKKHDS